MSLPGVTLMTRLKKGNVWANRWGWVCGDPVTFLSWAWEGKWADKRKWTEKNTEGQKQTEVQGLTFALLVGVETNNLEPRIKN